MDKHYKITIEYEGTNFSGWQVQPNKRTVQNEIEKALTQIYKKDIRIAGSGRTDTFVHALGQVAKFSAQDSISPEKITKALNANLPEDIAVVSCEETDEHFHPRFHAKSKIYRYQIKTGYKRPVLDRNFRYHYKSKLDIDMLHESAKLLEGLHDFTSFACVRGNENGEEDNHREIRKITINIKDEHIDIFFEGTGFLYKMVRMLAGTMLQYASAKLNKDELLNYLEQPEIASAGPALPGHGLTLMEVHY